jgi:hypothetical protein
MTLEYVLFDAPSVEKTSKKELRDAGSNAYSKTLPHGSTLRHFA